MSKLATTRPDDWSAGAWVARAAAFPASRKPSSEYTSTGPCSIASSSGTSSRMCTYLAGSVIDDLSWGVNATSALTMPDAGHPLVHPSGTVGG